MKRKKRKKEKKNKLQNNKKDCGVFEVMFLN